ncbi:MAG: ABC transporter permease [Firmicutes bacterium]|nr:ABC transporter permease [Bacillota bacterium]
MTKRTETTKKIIARSIVIGMLILLYFPLMLLIVFSFTPSVAMGSWSGFSFSLYRDLFNNSRAMEAVRTTFLVAAISSAIAVILGTFTAIGIFNMKKNKQELSLAGTQITVINAEIVTGIAFATLFVAMMNINIPIRFGYVTLVIAHVMFITPFVILAVMPRLYRLNPNLYEAGLDLGAGPMKTMFTVVMPQLIPGMISGFALAFTISLDDFVVSSFNTGHLNTISTWLYNSRQGIPPESRALSALIFALAFIALVVLYIKNKKSQKAFRG